MSRQPTQPDRLLPDRPASGYDPLDPQVQSDPYPFYAALRRDAPLCPVPSMNGWAVARHDDVRYVLDHPGLFSSRIMARADRLLLGCDPPDHRATRERVQPHFTRSAARRLEAGIRRRCEALVADMQSHPSPDLVTGLAVPLPVATIAELFGLEPDDHARFAAWSQAYVARATGVSREPCPDDLEQATKDFRRFIRGVVEARREQHPEGDLIGLLAGSERDTSESTEEVVDLCMLLLVGGNETTTNLITNAVDALLWSPALLGEALASPALAGAIVRETLRYDPPVQLVLRLATKDVEIAGGAIPQGAAVVALLGSANRDEERFAHADRFDPHRARRRHLAFGSGIHFCVGAHLAELQAGIAVRCLLERNARIDRGAGPPRRLESFQLRGLRALPLSLKPR